MVSEAVIDALYEAMLGRPADAEGLAHWQSAGSVREVIDGLAATERYLERCRALLGGTLGRDTEDLGRAAWRLEFGRGLVELADLPPTVSAHAAFEVLPWSEVGACLASPRARVIGRYARELAAELISREQSVTVEIGLEPGEMAEVDILILTQGQDLGGLLWARPDVVRRVAHRLVLPLQTDSRSPADEAERARATMHVALHDLGFTQVRQVFRRRYDGGALTVATSFATPSPGVLHRMEERPIDGPLPPSRWFVADRVATTESR